MIKLKDLLMENNGSVVFGILKNDRRIIHKIGNYGDSHPNPESRTGKTWRFELETGRLSCYEELDQRELDRVIYYIGYHFNKSITKIMNGIINYHRQTRDTGETSPTPNKI